MQFCFISLHGISAWLVKKSSPESLGCRLREEWHGLVSSDEMMGHGEGRAAGEVLIISEDSSVYLSWIGVPPDSEKKQTGFQTMFRQQRSVFFAEVQRFYWILTHSSHKTQTVCFLKLHPEPPLRHFLINKTIKQGASVGVGRLAFLSPPSANHTRPSAHVHRRMKVARRDVTWVWKDSVPRS